MRQLTDTVAAWGRALRAWPPRSTRAVAASLLRAASRMLDALAERLALALGVFAFDRFVLSPQREAAARQQTPGAARNACPGQFGDGPAGQGARDQTVTP